MSLDLVVAACEHRLSIARQIDGLGVFRCERLTRLPYLRTPAHVLAR